MSRVECMTFIFVSGHVGIRGNKRADSSKDSHCGRGQSYGSISIFLNAVRDTGWDEFLSSEAGFSIYNPTNRTRSDTVLQEIRWILIITL